MGSAVRGILSPNYVTNTQSFRDHYRRLLKAQIVVIYVMDNL